MYGVIGENDSDVRTLGVIIKRLAGNKTLPIRMKGYEGCGEMLRKGARQLQLFENLGCTRFVVSYDADQDDPDDRYHEAQQKIVWPSGVNGKCCLVVPVQEIEAWIIADIAQLNRVFSSWKPGPIRENPEQINSPKEFLEI